MSLRKILFPRKNLFPCLALLVGVMLIVLPVFSASAQEATPLPDNQCLSCHEDLYYLHDTGKSFCLCAEKMTCTCCHGGNPQSLIEKEAHQGMVTNPIHGDTSPCQQCHSDDARARMEKFAAVAGVSAFHAEASTPTIVTPADIETPPAFLLQWLEPWQWAGLGGLALGLIVLIILGYRCWKADCLMKRSS